MKNNSIPANLGKQKNLRVFCPFSQNLKITCKFGEKKFLKLVINKKSEDKVGTAISLSWQYYLRCHVQYFQKRLGTFYLC